MKGEDSNDQHSNHIWLEESIPILRLKNEVWIPLSWGYDLELVHAKQAPCLYIPGRLFSFLILR